MHENLTRKNLVFDSFVSKTLAFYNCSSYMFKLSAYPIKTYVGDMYKTDNSTRSSITLAKVSANLRSVYWHFL